MPGTVVIAAFAGNATATTERIRSAIIAEVNSFLFICICFFSPFGFFCYTVLRTDYLLLS